MAGFPHDYHLHSSLSIDCDVPMAAQCERAIELGIRELCITEHCDWHPLDMGVGYYRPEAYFAELERCRAAFAGRLILRAGVEVSEVHSYNAEAAALTSAWPYDLVLGSLHWVDDMIVLDEPYFAQRSATESYNRYFAELAAMVRAGGFDIVGHLDVPKRVGFRLFKGYRAEDYAEPIQDVLRACVETGIGIELNTSTYRMGLGEPSPSLAVARWYRQLGGEILTIGSDAHHPSTVGSFFPEALDLARAAGFRYLANFEQRTPMFTSID